MNTKTRVTVFCALENDLPIVEKRIKHWFGGVVFNYRLLESQVLVYCSRCPELSDLIYSAACAIFDRDKGEAAVFEYDQFANIFIRRSQTWMDEHYEN